MPLSIGVDRVRIGSITTRFSAADCPAELHRDGIEFLQPKLGPRPLVSAAAANGYPVGSLNAVRQKAK